TEPQRRQQRRRPRPPRGSGPFSFLAVATERKAMSAMRDEKRWSRRDRPEVPARVPAPLRTEPLENRLPAESGLYPLFVKLQGRRALVVGGGPIGFQKTIDLLRSGARVHAVATAWIDDFAALAGNPALTRSTRPF